MRGRDWLESVTPELGWHEVLDAIREEFGRGAVGFLADALGVTDRTARRYYSGEIAEPSRHREQLAGVIKRAERRAAADLLRQVDTLDPGTIKVKTKSGKDKQGSRDPGELTDMAAGMQRVADLWERGADDRAEEALSDAVIARYFQEDSDDRHGGAALLEISDYTHINSPDID